MKNNKKLVSAVAAAVMTLSLPATVYAVDYGGGDPGFSSAPSSSSSATSGEITSAIESAVDKAVESAVGAAVESAAESASEASGPVATVEVKSVAKLPVSAAVVKDLVKSGATLEIVSPKVTVSIDPATVTKAAKLDLSMKLANTDKRTLVNLTSKKNFGCEVKIAVTGCKLSAKKLAKAHVYCDGEDLGPVELNEDGVPVITAKKGGKYEIR